MVSLTILHLTDLHFGCDASELESASRQLCLDSLLKTVAAQETEWRPKAVCVTGDIGWRGAKADYDLAKTWLEQLLQALRLKPRDVFVCAGNHDIDRRVARTIGRPADAREADSLLAPPIGPQYTSAFAAFTTFCTDIGIHPYIFQGEASYLLGETTFHGVRFVALNSAWFCKGDDDKDKLWVGWPHLQVLQAANQLHLVRQENGPPTVALVHHPPNWWHEAETHVHGTRPNTRDYLAHRAHLILTGHTHAEVRPSDRIAEAALHLTGGSAYSNYGYFNTFRLIRVEHGQLVHRSFEFDPRSPEHAWGAKGDARTVPFAEGPPDRTQVAVPASVAPDLAELRRAAIADAWRVLELKSRQIKPHGVLPEPIRLLVGARVSSHQDRYDETGRLRTEAREIHRLPLEEMVQFDRRAVLLGDLGSGKSTLAARFVIETMERIEGSLSILIPARSLQLDTSCTVRDVLTACSRYVYDQVAPHASPVSLQDLLSQRVSVRLVIDGLDEMSQGMAAGLLRQLATLTDCWPTIQVLVTGRPVELAGVSYEAWGQCFIEPLTDEDREALFRSEAACEGQNPSAAEETARQRMRALKREPLLNQVARTVLAVRLLYPKLSGSGLTHDQSVGDLLTGLLMDRLGEWPQADLKPCPFDRFEGAFPTPSQRAELLGVLALAFKNVTALPRLAAVQALLARTGNDHLLAEQALGYFRDAGLLNVTGSETLEFVFQPLKEVAAGTAILACWLRDATEAMSLAATGWRAQSFAAGQAFRRGVLSQVRTRLRDVLSQLLEQPLGVPAACMVVSEARDADTAQEAVRALRALGRKPLRTFSDEEFASNHAIAKALYLAGEPGFDWLFEEYLDARYPIVHRGSAIVERVFHHWAWLAGKTLSETQLTRLRPLVQPLLAVPGMFTMLPSLAFLVPEEFSEEERLWHQAAYLDDDLFGPWAEEEITQVASLSPDLVRDVLRLRSVNSRSAGPLYLRLFAGTPLPLETLRGVIRWWGIAPDSQACQEAVRRCEQALGPPSWQQFLCFSLTDPERAVAAGAALLLHQANERRIPVLGDVLLEALHDGGYIPRAEEVLGTLLDEDRPRAARWLSGKIASYKDMSGAHSGWWRLLFRTLDPVAPESPNILAGCIGGIGPFLLARHAAVRAGFRELLQGGDGSRFREALKRLLEHPEPSVRHGAASVLLVCDPAVSADALLTVVATRSELLAYDHEWEGFCLTLSIGPTLLTALHSKLDTLSRDGRALALAILHRNGHALKPQEREEFYAALLEVGNWRLWPAVEDRQGRAAETWFNFLERQVEGGDGERAQRAADYLLMHFNDRLSAEQHARCRFLASQNPHASPGGFEEEVARTQEEGLPETSAASRNVGEAPKLPGLLALVAETRRNPARWKDVVWDLCCQEGFGMETEDGGQLLLNIGRRFPAAGAHIGSAALAFVDDERLKKWQADARHWLALLASEFASLPAARIRQVLSGEQPIFGSATRALIARLGEVPEQMVRRQTTVDMPDKLGTSAPLPSTETLWSRLVECGRDAAALHPDTCDLIARTLSAAGVEENQVTRVGEQGRVGAAIAMALRFCVGLPHSLLGWMPLIEDGMLFWNRQNPCWERVAKIGRMAHEAALEERAALREEYCRLLDAALRSGQDSFGIYAMELLRWQKGFTASQVRPVFEALAVSRPTAYQQQLWGSLVPWIAALEAGPLASAVGDAAEHAVLVLSARGFPKEQGNRIADPAIVFPLACWALTGTCRLESIAVYWYGLRFLFTGTATGRGVSHVRSLFEALAPLAQKVSPSIWEKVRRDAPVVTDPALSTLLHAFASLSGGGAREPIKSD